MRTTTVVAVLLSLTASATNAQSAGPTVSTGSLLPDVAQVKRITVTRDRSHVYYSNDADEIFLYDPVRKQATRLTLGAHVSDPYVSTDGRLLAYAGSDKDSDDQWIWIVPLDPTSGLPSDTSRKVSQIQGRLPVLSPDGKWVAFARGDSAFSESVIVASFDGGTERAIASFATQVGATRWSPDSRSLFISVNPVLADGHSVGTIQRVELESGQVAQLAVTNANSPGLSPDGKWLVYRDTGHTRTVIVAGSDGRRVSSFVAPRGGSLVSWLGDSDLLIATSPRAPSVRTFGLLEKQSRIVIDTLDGPKNPSWAPDGKSFVVADSVVDRWSFVLFDKAGRHIRTIKLDDTYTGTLWWSPDSKWIVYNAIKGREASLVKAVDVATGLQIEVMRGKHWMASAWSRDSKSIIMGITDPWWSRTMPRNSSILGRDLALGKTRTLRTLKLQTRSWAWPVDETHVIVNGDREHPTVLYSLGSDSTEVQLLPAMNGFITAPTYSRDRKWVTFRRNSKSNDNDHLDGIEVMQLDGSNRVTFTFPFTVGKGELNAQFLPSNDEFLLVENPAGRDSASVYLVRRATGEATKLFNAPAFDTKILEFSLSPDGRTILYAASERAKGEFKTISIPSLAKK